jgi:hypothetical protein
VAANKRLGSLGITPSPAADNSIFRPAGNKYPTVSATNKLWATADVEGTPTYDEIVLALGSVFSAPTSSQILDGATPTGVYTHVITPKSEGADTPWTYTIEKGDPAGTLNAEKMTYGLFTDFGLDISRDGIDLDGSLLGQAMTTLQTMTGAPTVLPQVPILPGQFSVWAADNTTDLGTATGTGVKLASVISAGINVGGRYNPAWFLNAALSSFASVTEDPEPDYNIDFLAEADAAGLNWLTLLSTGATRFLRLEAVGPTVYTPNGGKGYKFTWDFATKVTDPGDFSDEDGVYAVGPTLQIVHDGTWGKSSVITVQNKQASY